MDGRRGMGSMKRCVMDGVGERPNHFSMVCMFVTIFLRRVMTLEKYLEGKLLGLSSSCVACYRIIAVFFVVIIQECPILLFVDL